MDIIKLRSGFLSHSTARMLRRVRSVYLFMREKDSVTTADIADEFNITKRTAQRDLKVLVYNDLVKSPSRGKWTITKRKVKIS